MGYRLFREVLDHAPADLTMAERFVLAAIADAANDDTRKGWPTVELIAHRTGSTVDGVHKVIQRLRRRGYDIRVALKIGADGRKVYSWRGRSTTYQVPRFPERDVPTREKGRTDRPPFDGERVDKETVLSDGKGWTTSPERVDRLSTPSPQHLLKEQEQPRARTLNGATPGEHAAVLAEIRRRKPGATEALTRHCLREDGPKILAEIRANGQRAEAVAAIAELRTRPPCEHGEPGGNQPHPTSGQPLCALCRAQRKATT